MARKLPLVMIFAVVTLALLFYAAQGVASASAYQQGTAQAGTPEPTALEGVEKTALTPTDLLEGVIMTRTPEPTATPGRLEL